VKIHFEWPASRPGIVLDESLTEDNALALNVNNGVFGPHTPQEARDVIVFYRHMNRAVLLNLCAERLCCLDGVEIAYGRTHPLHHGNEIQAGHFKLSVVVNGDKAADEQSFYRLIYPDKSWERADKVPEVEEILPNGGNIINDLRYFNDVVLAQDRGNDVLKTLEVEYKRFLIWREQEGASYTALNHQDNHILKTDLRFDAIREQIKGKTLTECIIDKPFLMEKVWPELNVDRLPDDIFVDDEKHDILEALSPEHFVSKGKNKLPELVFQDFYKVGLDSHY